MRRELHKFEKPLPLARGDRMGYGPTLQTHLKG